MGGPLTEQGQGDPPSQRSPVPEAEPPAPAPTLESLQVSIQELLDMFSTRLQYDAHKDEIISRLLDNAQALSAEARDAALRPLLLDLLLFHDSLRAHRDRIASQDAWAAPDLIPDADGLLAEAAEVLARQDVLEYIPPDASFNPRFQRPIATEAAPSNREVLRSARPGFTWRGNRLRPQDVVLAKSPAQEAPPGYSPALEEASH